MPDVTYFPSADEAATVCALLQSGYPDARVVPFERGHAVQYHKSGPYWPADHRAGCRWCPQTNAVPGAETE